MTVRNFFLLAVPMAIAAEVFHLGPVVIFVLAGLGIIPLAGILGEATEQLSDRLGPGIGGFLNATFGNATELIIGLMALYSASQLASQAAAPPAGKTAQQLMASADNLVEVVKASITGSIIGNLLFILGLAFLVGGLGRDKQVFSAKVVGVGNAMMTLAVAGLMAPSIVYWLDHLAKGSPHIPDATFVDLSDHVAVVLLVIYLLSLVFSFKTHRHLYRAPEDEDHAPAHVEEHWTTRKAVTILVVSTAVIAVLSEILVGSLDAAGKSMGLNPIFMGLVVVAMVGNAAEHASAVMIARKDKMDLAINIAMGSSMQVALLLAPIMVLASNLGSKTMTLVFTPLELAAVGISTAITTIVNLDGESNWLEGAQLLSVYAILALAFYHAF
ncbi:MAG: calcium/proton exchanger [Candidatus Riflebacteria bacterium]|nr:calcium/proton exchanger [Candidatus Riflebacteria bacterium]